MLRITPSMRESSGVVVDGVDAKKAKKRETDKRYYQENAEAAKERSRRWVRENPAKNREKCRRWRQENQEKRAEYYKRYRQENLEKILERSNSPSKKLKKFELRLKK